MTYKERIEREKDNRTAIFLYSDRGLFFNLLERSAYAFHTRIKPFKVHVRTLKGLDEPYVTLGFPVSKGDDYLQGLTVGEEDGGCLVARLDEPIDEAAYLAWKMEMISRDGRARAAAGSGTPIVPSVACEEVPGPLEIPVGAVVRQVIHDVKSLNLASVTPMEAMLYLNELQRRLKDVKL